MTGDGHWARVLALVAGTAPDLQSLCAACVASLPTIRGASVTVMTRPGGGTVPVATDAVSGRIEELQYSLGEGPCVDATSGGQPVLVADLASAEYGVRWPGFAAGAVAAGAAALYAFPLRVGAIRLGALSLYRAEPAPLSQAELAGAITFADAATLLLLSTGVDGTFEVDLGRRAVVHQATGMVKVQLGVGIEEAFVRLRARAYVDERSLEELSREVVERRLRFDEMED